MKGNGNAGGGGVMIVNQHAERMAIASVVEDVSGKICRQLVPRASYMAKNAQSAVCTSFSARFLMPQYNSGSARVFLY